MSRAYRLELVRHFINMKRFDEAEAELLGIPANNPHSCVLKIQLSIKSGHFQNAIASIHQLSTIDGIDTSHFISLVDTNPVPIKLHVYRAMLKIEPQDPSVLKKMLSIAETSAGIPFVERVNIVLTYGKHCHDDKFVRKVAWKVAEEASRSKLYAHAAVLLQSCFDRVPENASGERFLASFYMCEAIYDNPEHAYTDVDYQNLAVSMQLFERTFPKSSPEGTAIRGRSKQKYQQSLRLFMAKASIRLSKWDEVRAVITEVPIEELISLILNSTVDVPIDIYSLCLRKLLASVTSNNIAHSTTLFRRMATEELLRFDISSIVEHFRQAYPLVSSSECPREHSVWFCLACLDTAVLAHNWKSYRNSQEWLGLATSFYKHLHPEDQKVHESRIRNVLGAIQGTE